MSPISEVPFTTIGVIKAKIMNKENNNNEITLKYLLNTITSPSRLFFTIDYIYCTSCSTKLPLSLSVTFHNACLRST